MALQAAICTQCGAQIQVDESKEAGICPNCGTAFITEKVIHQFVTQNNFSGATINVQGGVDIENLYTLARRAVESLNTDDVLRYYGQIREREPNDWEAAFFYSWFSNSETFDADFKIIQDLILRLAPEDQVEVLHKLYDFLKKINFEFSELYGSYKKENKFPLKNQQLFYDFIMRFFDEKNIDVVNMAAYLTNYMFTKYSKEFYYKILSRQDKFYLQYLQNFRSLIYDNYYRKDDSTREWARIISEVERDIEKLNLLLDSEEEKKKTYLDYYEWLLGRSAERLTLKNINSLKNKILEINPSYTFSDWLKSIVKNKQKAKRRGIFSILNSFVLTALSFIAGKLIYKIGEGESSVNIILIALGIANFLSIIKSISYASNKKTSVFLIIIKTLILLALIFFFVSFFHFKPEV